MTDKRLSNTCTCPHLRYNKLSSNQQRPQQVPSAIVPHLIDGNLDGGNYLVLKTDVKAAASLF